MHIRVHKGYYRFNIQEIEKHYGGVYMGDFSIKDKNGEYTDQPVAVFYQPTPDVEKGYSHYFGLFTDPWVAGVMICDASSAFEEPLVGIETDEGDILISCFRHDYYEQGKYCVDGGRAYFRSNLTGKIVHVKIEKYEFKKILPTENDKI